MLTDFETAEYTAWREGQRSAIDTERDRLQADISDAETALELAHEKLAELDAETEG